MNWRKLILVLIIVLLYVPMVFLGANVFFPEYTGMNSYYRGMENCYSKYPYPEKLTETQRQTMDEDLTKCQQEYQQAQEDWEKNKLAYEGQKYVFITLFNLIILLLALFLPKLQQSISLGLFLGSIATTFGATLRYFDSRSKIGFIVLVITFAVTLFFIQKKKENFLSWKKN